LWFFGSRASEVTTVKAGTTLDDVIYEYDDAGYGQGALRARVIDVLALKTTRYQYDALDRLTRARTYTTGTTAPADSSTCAADARLACYEYGLDASGNRTQRTVTGSSVPNSTTSYVYNDANELSTRTAGASVSTYAYDANGNQTIRTGAAPRTLGYNLRDQTTNLAGTAIGYLGAGQDQAVSEGATALQYNVLGLSSRSSAGTISYYTRAIDGSPLAQRTGTSREYYTADALGSTIRTTDAAGTTKATYAL
jgi:YD repeat-containing protein